MAQKQLTLRRKEESGRREKKRKKKERRRKKHFSSIRYRDAEPNRIFFCYKYQQHKAQ